MPLPLLPVIFSGNGSNLYPLCDASGASSSSTPFKALLPVANRPLIAFTLQNLLSAGLTSCLLVAPASQHSAISRSLASIRLSPPVSPTMLDEKRKGKESKEERKHISVASVDSLVYNSVDAMTMKVELLPFGPHDGKDTEQTNEQVDFRRHNLGTAELLRWIASIGKLDLDPLVLPVDLISPAMPLSDLVNAYMRAQASPGLAPTAYCSLYERGAGDGTGREREREGPPRMIYGYSNEERKTHTRLLLAQDADIDADMLFKQSLLRASPRLRLSTRLLDSHAYIFNKAHLLPLLEANPTLTSLREHVIPLVAKASWMKGLAEKANWSVTGIVGEEENNEQEEDDDDVSKRLAKLKKDTTLLAQSVARSSRQPSRGQSGIQCLTVISTLKDEDDAGALPAFVARANTVPTFLECNRWALKALHAATSSAVEFPAMSVEASDSMTTSNDDAETLQAATAQISPDSIIGIGVRIGDRASIKRTVVGSKCEVGRGVKLSGCVLFEGCKVLENARLENVIVCAGAVIGEKSSLKDCDVGPSMSVAANTTAKNQKLVSGDENDGDMASDAVAIGA